MPEILALRRWTQEDWDFKASLNCIESLMPSGLYIFYWRHQNLELDFCLGNWGNGPVGKRVCFVKHEDLGSDP